MNMPKHFLRFSIAALISGAVAFLLAGHFDDGTLVQSNRIDASSDQDVYRVNFPIPYASSPHLEISPSSFKYNNLIVDSLGFEFNTTVIFNNSVTGSWVAKGVVDDEQDPRPLLRRLSIAEQFFVGVGFLGSICSFIGLSIQFRDRGGKG